MQQLTIMSKNFSTARVVECDNGEMDIIDACMVPDFHDMFFLLSRHSQRDIKFLGQ